ncbi:MAG: TolC family protein, partial [Planctomycetota bacterium]
DQEAARFEATFSGSARFSRQDTPTALATEGSNVDIDSYDLGLEIPLRTGGTANISVPFSRTETDNVFALLDPSYDADLRFSISQPLLRNAGPRVNLHALRVARGQEQIAGARTKLEAIRILANADRAYWRLYGARRQLEVRLEEYRLAIEQLETAERRVNAGDAPGIEVTRARSGVAETLQLIIVAENAVRQRQRDLKRIMNFADMPINSTTVILPATEPNPVWREFEPDVLAAYAVANRMEMLELELQLAIDASAVDFERNQALPLFVVDYSYNLGGIGATYNDAFDRIADRSFEDHLFGVSAEIPIGNDVARSRVHRSILTRLQRLATKEQRQLAIRQEVYDALDALEEAWQRILAARLESSLAGETFEAERRQFDVGLRTSTDVLDAATRLSNAQASEVRALADYEIAQIDLAFATGTLLGAQAVRWEAIDIDEDEIGYFGQGAVTPPPLATDRTPTVDGDE